MPASQLHEGRHKEGTGDFDHAMQALPKEAAATPPRIEQLKENMRPAAYNVEASALHFIKPTKVPALSTACHHSNDAQNKHSVADCEA